MLPETIPTDVEAPSEKQEKIEEPKPHKKQVKTYSGAYLQVATITIGWVLVIALLSTVLGPIWIDFMTITVLASQTIVVLAGLGLTIYQRERNNDILFVRSYPEWPRMQKLLTLPENYIKESFDELSILDILGSLIGFGIIFLSILSSRDPWYVLFIAIPACGMFFSKMIIGVIRRKSLDPTKRFHSEFLVTFGSLLFLDCSLIWLIFRWMSTFNAWAPFVWMYAIAWGPVLLFQLVMRGQNLYWDRIDSTTHESPPTPTKEETKEILKRVGKNRNSSIARIVGWIIAFCIIPAYCSIISNGTPSLSYTNSVVSLTLFLGPIYIVPVGIYFIIRKLMVSDGKSKTVFGERSRPEALVDLVVSSTMVFGFTSSFSYTLNSPTLVNIYWMALHDLGSYGARYFLIGFIGFYLLLVGSLGIRIIGNILEAEKEGSFRIDHIFKLASHHRNIIEGRSRYFCL